MVFIAKKLVFIYGNEEFVSSWLQRWQIGWRFIILMEVLVLGCSGGWLTRITIHKKGCLF